MTPRLASLAFAAALAPFLAAPAAAQLCPNANDTFWKNDTLPQVPSGGTPVGVIRGLCEGEAGAQAFTLPGGMGPQRLTKVAAGFGDIFGSGGFVAAANVEIYDGLTWSGAIPVLGSKVFDLENDTSSSIQLSSHAINELDLSAFNVEVGHHASRAFVVAFRISINFNGNCTSGYSANLFTDSSGGGACTTIPKTSLIDIAGVGWRDAAVATISGIPLCPLFYNGNWVIRACSTDAGSPPVCQTDLGLAGPGNLRLDICGQPLASGNSADFLVTNAQPNALVYVLASASFNPTFVGAVWGVLGPLPIQMLVGQLADGTGTISLPGAVQGGGGSYSVYVQAIAPDPPQFKGWEVSNCLRVDILP